MKNNKKLMEIYEKYYKIRSNDCYNNKFTYFFEDFKRNAKDFIKDVKKTRIIMGVTVSKSGMTRHFNTLHHNAILNICYNNKFTWDSVRVGGCGMDMAWHMLLTTCKQLMTEKEIEKHGINYKCSSYSIL